MHVNKVGTHGSHSRDQIVMQFKFSYTYVGYIEEGIPRQNRVHIGGYLKKKRVHWRVHKKKRVHWRVHRGYRGGYTKKRGYIGGYIGGCRGGYRRGYTTQTRHET
jgi:hypothetical protein